jgi:transcriptional regulator with XRE-family HTH domain
MPGVIKLNSGFGARIKEVRERSNFSLSDIAHATGWGEADIIAIEDRRNEGDFLELDMDFVCRVCRVLGLRVADFVNHNGITAVERTS